MDISEKDIEWTKGTDKTYGQVVFEHWQKTLGKNPTVNDLTQLRNQKLALESQLKDLWEEHKQILKNINLGDQSALDLLELIELKEDALSRINELLEDYSENKSVPAIIHKIAKRGV